MTISINCQLPTTVVHNREARIPSAEPVLSTFLLRPTDETEAPPSLVYPEDLLHKVERTPLLLPSRASRTSVGIFVHPTFGLADYRRPTGDMGLLKKQWELCGKEVKIGGGAVHDQFIGSFYIAQFHTQ